MDGRCMADSPADSSTVFISYSQQDAAFLARLQQALAPSAPSLAIPLWDDTPRQPGDDWKRSIEQALARARVALLLVSGTFLAAEVVANGELPGRLTAAEARGTRILPVVLTTGPFKGTLLSRFQAINDPARPLGGLSQHEQDLEWERVAATVLEVLDAPGSSSTPQPGTLLLTCQGARQAILHGVAWSPDGTRLASAGQDGAVRVWDAESGRELLVYQGSTDRLRGVAWSPDGARLASASQDGAVRVWDAESGRELVACAGHNGPAYAVAWSPDGALLASTGDNRKVRVWDAASGQQILACVGHRRQTLGVAWSPDGARLASTGVDRTVRVWEATSGQQILACQGHADEAWGVAWSPDGTRLASASLDKTVRVWDAESLRELVVCQWKEYGMAGVAWSPDGLRLASTCKSGVVRVWEAASGRELLVCQGQEGDVWSVAWAPDGTRLASAGQGGSCACGMWAKPTVGPSRRRGGRLWRASSIQRKLAGASLAIARGWWPGPSTSAQLIHCQAAGPQRGLMTSDVMSPLCGPGRI
jgi:dipeptidyl aminopeptidase/acylaminoacyl peptidase